MQIIKSDPNAKSAQIGVSSLAELNARKVAETKAKNNLTNQEAKNMVTYGSTSPTTTPQNQNTSTGKSDTTLDLTSVRKNEVNKLRSLGFEDEAIQLENQYFGAPAPINQTTPKDTGVVLGSDTTQGEIQDTTNTADYEGVFNIEDFKKSLKESGYNLPDTDNTEFDIGLELTMNDLEDEYVYNVQSNKRSTELAQKIYDVTKAQVERTRKLGESKLTRQLKDYQELSEVEQDRIEQLADEDITSLLGEKDKAQDRMRRILGTGAQSTGGLATIQEVADKYDSAIKSKRSERDYNLTKLMISQDSTEQGYAEAIADIENNAIKGIENLGLSYITNIINAEDKYQNNELLRRKSKSTALQNYISGIYNAEKEAKREALTTQKTLFDIKKGNLDISKMQMENQTMQDELGIVSTDNPYDVILNGELRTGGTAAWRNNNPGNIKYEYGNGNISGMAQKLIDAGIPIQKGSKAMDGGYFITFPTLEDGKQAQIDLLKSAYASSTVNDAMKKWSGNSYGGEIVGFGNKRISQLTDAEFSQLVDAQIKREGYKEGEIKGGGQGKLDNFSQQILDNPRLLQTLTATERGDTLKKLSRAGVDLSIFGNTYFQKLDNKEYDKIKDLVLLRNRVASIKKLKPDVKTGAYDARATQAKRFVGIDTTDFDFLEQNTGRMLADYIKEISGAAVSEQEAQRLGRNVPNVYMQDKQFDNAVTTFENELNTLIKAKVAKFGFKDENELRSFVGADPLNQEADSQNLDLDEMINQVEQATFNKR